ncbi:alpha/beta fold hydrolase [Terricaulis sp.]|uniref:alpha/beta fold hydrolase n=1 Tax=Terricaulis sp. TaxID=2768686 RepID=UPI0037830DEA
MAQARVNGITIEYDVQGPENGEPLLMIMGLGSQLTRWAQPLLDKFHARGMLTIRFDNRDVGLSEKFKGLPNLQDVIAQRMAGQTPAVPYTLDDMAADAVGVLDHLGIARAHVVGASMGGMIGQLVTADHGERVLSFTSIMSTTGNPALPPATPEAMAVLLTPAPNPHTDEQAYLDHMIRNARTIGSPAYPFDEALVRQRLGSDAKRCYEPAGVLRQMCAVTANGDRRAKLATITAPVCVIHGEDDPLVPVDGGRDTAASIPGAEFVLVPGMGHDVPPGLYDLLVDNICRNAARAKQPA